MSDPKTSSTALLTNGLLTEVYNATVKECQERENKGAFSGNSHHFAMQVREDAKELFKKRLEGCVILDKKTTASLLALIEDNESLDAQTHMPEETALAVQGQMRRLRKILREAL